MPQVSEPMPIRHVNLGHKFYLRSSVLHRFHISQMFVDFFYELASYQAMWPSDEAGPFIDDILGNMTSRMNDLRQYRRDPRPSTFPRTCLCERGPAINPAAPPFDFDFNFPPSINSYSSQLPSGPLEISFGESYPHHLERSVRGRTPPETIPEAPSPTESEKNFDYIGDSEDHRAENDAHPDGTVAPPSDAPQGDKPTVDDTADEPAEPGPSNPRQARLPSSTRGAAFRPRIIDPASALRASRLRSPKRPLKRTYAMIGEIAEDGSFRRTDYHPPPGSPTSRPEPRPAKGKGREKADDAETNVEEEARQADMSIAGGSRKRRRERSTTGGKGSQESGPSRTASKRSKREDDEDDGGSRRVRARQ